VRQAAYQAPREKHIGLDSSHAALTAPMVRSITPLRYTPERLLATGERSNTSSGRAPKHLVPTTISAE
jgi:hypothetical protein